MGKTYADAELVETFAKRLLKEHHSELATARIRYIWVSEASKKSGRPVLGKVRKISGALQFLTDLDFLVEVALDQFNDLTEKQREALVDHLLQRCHGEEDEKTGEMKWSIRDPDVQEFSEILDRHGAWNEDLRGFVTIAHAIDVDALVDDVVSSAADDITAVN